MKCPSIIKGKKKETRTCGAELQTKRTLANGTKVRRERACPKCGTRLWTVEQFEINLQEAEFAISEERRRATQEIRNLQEQISEHENFFLGFRDLMDKAAATVKK
jgi:transcriptional regulator NrdR family protein